MIERYTVDSGMLPSNRYKNEKGEISMITPSWVSSNMFEIYCIEGNLFEDIERYDTLEEAEKRIYELLGEMK